MLKRSRFRKHKLNKFFGLALAASVLSFSASVTATYAWFSLNDVAVVQNLSMDISGEDKYLHIGWKDENGNIINSDSFDENDLENIFPGFSKESVLDPLTSNYQDEWLNSSTVLADARPVLRKSYQPTSPRKSEVADKGFFQFDFYFTCDEDSYLFLADGSKMETNVEKNRDTAERFGLNVEDLNKAIDALRISFLSDDSFHIAEFGEEVSNTRLGGPLDVWLGDGYYDSSNGKETIYGEYEGEVNYLPALPEDSEGYSAEDRFFPAKHRAGIEIADLENVAFKEEDTVTFSSMILPENAGTFYPDVTHPITRLKANIPQRVVVTVYAEGWDLDHTNLIARASLTMHLSFTALIMPEI
ncbi:MAG: hypothetical protein K5694_07320 [Bacilli bacterium]|nr:hypothetical protein [Bacilli bacterium]